jgi:hypothetical protein
MASKGRKLMWSGAVLAVALVGAELTVRALAPAQTAALISPLAFQRHEHPISSPGPVPGTKRFGGPDIVTRAEPAGVRIFFFGGSATQGFHMSPWSSFPGWVQRLLRVAVPDVPIEVINLGAGGEGSRQVLELVRAAASSETAHLFIVYSGNNEYYELRALKDVLPGFDARTELARRRVSRFHLYRWVRDWVQPAKVRMATGPIRPVDSLNVEIDADERALGVLLYREHMAAIAAAARAGGVPLMLATVADHRMSYAFHGDPPARSPGVDAGIAALDRARGRRNPAEVDQVLADLQGKLKTEGDYHEVGRLLHRDQLYDRAHKYFVEAEYLDPRPRRSNRAMRAMVREVGTDTSTPVCDVSAALDRRAVHGLPGDDFFMDPCHPTPRGHRAIAEIMLGCVLENGLLPMLGDNAAVLARVKAAVSNVPLAGVEAFRLDHFTERRAQLHENRAMTTTEVGRAIREFDDGTAEGAALAGHHAVLFHRPRAALTWYAQAGERGGPTGPLMLSRGLVFTTLGDVLAARAALDAAGQHLPEDVELRQHRQVLGSGS